jgi:hypothetical protein
MVIQMLKKNRLASVLQSGDFAIKDSSAYTLHRILHGVPEGFTDIPNASAFPMDSNIDIMGGGKVLLYLDTRAC